MRVVLDATVRVRAGGRVLVGGAPTRLLRLSEAGAAALRRLRAGQDGPAEDLLARRLLAAGLAHPRLPPARAAPPREGAAVAAPPAAAPLVVVPVHGRPDELDRCLASLDGAPVLVVDDASPDGAAIAAVCARHGAHVLRRDVQGGPAAARNTALRATDAPVLAFLDSDCVATPAWAARLAALFAAEPALAAVAPRIRPLPAPQPRSALARYVDGRFILDMGPRDALVAPGRPVSYVPSAAMVVRRSALQDVRFDEDLQVGEDVDLVWRLTVAGETVRYVAVPLVAHAHPASWRALLRRRASYGTAAAALHRRHPGAVAPLVLAPWPAVATALALAGRPRLAAAAALVPAAALRRRHPDVPVVDAVRIALAGAVTTLEATGRAATWFTAPLLLAGLAWPRTRRAAATLLLVHPVRAYARTGARLDPLRFALATLADEAAYGAGVLRGCVAVRTAAPLLPRRGG